MQKLIESLLEYSRLSRDKEFSPVDTQQAVAGALANLQTVVRENRAEGSMFLFTIPANDD